MNKKGQAALEYLMTYGWALIVIAIVVGVLVFIVAAPTGNVRCSSSDPTKLNVVSNNIGASTAAGDLVITNTSGGEMTDVTIAESDAFGAITTVDGSAWTDGTTDLSVGNHTITVPATTTAGTYSSGTLDFTYTDPTGLSQSASITCQGISLTVT